MKSIVESTCCFINDTPPVGVYLGHWSGYEVRFHVDTVLWVARTIVGIRGSVDVTVTVRSNGIEIETK